jgi:transcriptional antiterminator RfaH
MDNAAWFVVATYPAREYRARDELVDREGVRAEDVWLPECKVRRRLRGTVLTDKGPLFPGYLFLRLDPERADWRRIEGVRWVDGVLRHQRRPWPLRADDVARLQALAGDQLVIEMDGAIRRELAIGGTVRLLDGPFRDWKGILSERVGDRLRVLLDIFGRATETLIPEALAVSA